MGGDIMGGGDGVGDLTVRTDEARTVLLVGRTGNGKSAAGNSILGKKAFKSRASTSGVTSTCELQRTVLRDGQIVNVIDTPGLFDLAAESDLAGKEIVKCIDLAKEGIHAILVVFSVRTRFSQQEHAAVRNLQTLFGNKIVDYMIPLFTGGDELEDNDETLEDYLTRECPQPLKEILALSKNRYVVFDNKTKDEQKRLKQVEQLLSLVNKVVAQNGGKPYMDELFTELKEGAIKLRNQQIEADDLREYSNLVETKLREATAGLEKQLVEEQAARLKVERNAFLAQKKSKDEIRMLRKNLGMAQEKLRKIGGICTIL